MRKVIIGVVAITLALIVIGIFIWIPKKKHASHIYVIPKKYHIELSGKKSIEIPVFFDAQKEDYVTEDSFGFLHNKDETHKVLVDSITAEKTYNEIIGNKTYYGYHLIVALPNITKITIDELYLTIFDKESSKTLYLGKLHIEKIQFSDELIKIKLLEGFKNEKMHLSQIVIEAFNDFYLESVYVGNQPTDFYQTGRKLIIYIDPEDIYYHDPYIKVIYEDCVQIFHNFNYFSQYNLMEIATFNQYLL